MRCARNRDWLPKTPRRLQPSAYVAHPETRYGNSARVPCLRWSATTVAPSAPARSIIIAPDWCSRSAYEPLRERVLFRDRVHIHTPQRPAPSAALPAVGNFRGLRSRVVSPPLVEERNNWASFRASNMRLMIGWNARMGLVVRNSNLPLSMPEVASIPASNCAGRSKILFPARLSELFFAPYSNTSRVASDEDREEEFWEHSGEPAKARVNVLPGRSASVRPDGPTRTGLESSIPLANRPGFTKRPTCRNSLTPSKLILPFIILCRPEHCRHWLDYVAANPQVSVHREALAEIHARWAGRRKAWGRRRTCRAFRIRRVARCRKTRRDVAAVSVLLSSHR